ncbi:hypothetical protein QE152_g5122 [Popillia japonica]|uniref:Uncharacterized protein n=1 Tax=Popillia japonica TaxID=7064 RepID=A0AAW1MXU8_POPJA
MQTVKLEPLNNSKEIEYVEKWGLRVNDLKNVPSEFTGNPLYLNFLRVVAKDPKLFENFSRFKLYEEVVNSKIKRSFARNPHFNSDNVENMKQSFEELALLRLFGKKQTKDVLVSISSKLLFTDQIRTKLLFTDQIRTGIITGVDDTIPIFIHFTFVEYFVSQWFVRSLEKPLLKQYAINFYKQLLIDKHARILEIEFEQSSLQNAIVEGKVLRVQQMLRDNLQCLEYIDRFNRTVLHIAAIHCRYHTHRHDPGYKILDKILQSMKNFITYDYISKHDMSGMTWAEYVNKEVFENMVLNNLFTTVEEYLKTEAQKCGRKW